MSAPAAALRAEQLRPRVGGPADRHGGAEPRSVAALLAALARVTGPAPDLAALADIRTRARMWPPPVTMPPGTRPRTTIPVPLVRSRPPEPLPGCAGGRDQVRCVATRSTAIRCSRCGTVTEIAKSTAGPQLAACDCAGDQPVCWHPPNSPRPLGAAHPDEATAG